MKEINNLITEQLLLTNTHHTCQIYYKIAKFAFLLYAIMKFLSVTEFFYKHDPNTQTVFKSEVTTYYIMQI